MVATSSTDFDEVLGFLSACSHLGDLEGKESAGFWEFFSRPFSVWDSFVYLVSSWSKCDRSFSSYSLVSIRCNFLSILFSHENVLWFYLLINFAFTDKKKKKTFLGNKEQCIAVSFSLRGVFHLLFFKWIRWCLYLLYIVVAKWEIGCTKSFSIEYRLAFYIALKRSSILNYPADLISRAF